MAELAELALYTLDDLSPYLGLGIPCKGYLAVFNFRFQLRLLLIPLRFNLVLLRNLLRLHLLQLESLLRSELLKLLLLLLLLLDLEEVLLLLRLNGGRGRVWVGSIGLLEVHGILFTKRR